MIGKIFAYESDGNGFNTKNYFYDDGKESVVFDSQFTPELARKSIDAFRAQGGSEIKYLVVTHPSPDKFNGLQVFRDAGARVVASEATKAGLEGVHGYKKYYFVNMAKMFTEETYPPLSQPDVTFADTYTIELAERTKIELRELHVGAVATNHTVAYIPGENILIVGDLIHHKAHAWLEGPIADGKTVYSTAAWIAALDKLLELYPANAMVCGGRGEQAVLGDAVLAQKLYLQKAEEITREYIESLAGADLTEKKSKADYAELTKRFETAFPDYALSYMVTYGAYGLVASL